MNNKFSRRDFIKVGGLALLGSVGATVVNQSHSENHQHNPASHSVISMQQGNHGEGFIPNIVGEVDHKKNGFNPTDVLTDFDYGKVSTLPDGRTLREYDIVDRKSVV